MSSTPESRSRPGRNLVAGLLLGLGIVAFFDETVFHQLLHWHHFYDRSTTDVGLVSDGLFHAFSWFATVAALFLLAQLRRDRALHVRRFVGGLPVRAAVLVLVVAAHDILAKTLYAHPPAGVDPGGAAVGAQVMYYGGAPVEIALFVLLGAEWFRRQGLPDQHRLLNGRRCPPPRPAAGSPAKYWSPAPRPSSRTPRRSSRAAPTQA